MWVVRAGRVPVTQWMAVMVPRWCRGRGGNAGAGGAGGAGYVRAGGCFGRGQWEAMVGMQGMSGDGGQGGGMVV